MVLDDNKMAIIAQQTLFMWNEIENLGDLERLRLVIEYMPNEELMNMLKRDRKNGRAEIKQCRRNGSKLHLI
jgi:hypothetical protein